MLSVIKLNKLFYNLVISYMNSLLGFVIYVLLARLLNVNDYSMIAIGLAVGGFIAPLLNLGSAKMFVRDAVMLDGTIDVEKLVLTNINIRVTVTVIVVFFLLLFSYLYMGEIKKAVIIALLSLWAGMLGLYPTSWFDFKHKTSKQNISVTFERIMVLFVIVGLMLVNVYEYQLILVAVLLLLTRILSVIYQVHLWWKMFSNIEFVIKMEIPKFNSYGVNIIFTIALLFNALMIYGNQLIYGKIGDEIELSAYSMAFQFISLIFLFQAQAIRVLNRDISEINKTNDDKIIIKNIFNHCMFLVIVSAFFSAIMFVLSKYLPVLIDDNRFEAISNYMPILCVWIVVVGAGQVVVQYLLENKQESFYLKVSVLSGLFAFILGIVYVPQYGAIAIAVILTLVHVLSISVNTMRLLYIRSYI